MPEAVAEQCSRPDVIAVKAMRMGERLMQQRLLVKLIVMTFAAGTAVAEDRSNAAAEGGAPSGTPHVSRSDNTDRNATPIVIAKMLLVDKQGNRVGVMFRFAVEDSTRWRRIVRSR